MKTFRIEATSYEIICYNDTYEVEAETVEEAKEMVLNREVMETDNYTDYVSGTDPYGIKIINNGFKTEIHHELCKEIESKAEKKKKQLLEALESSKQTQLSIQKQLSEL